MLFYLKFMFVFILFGFHSRLVVLFESKSREGQNWAGAHLRARTKKTLCARLVVLCAALCILTNNSNHLIPSL